MINHMSCFEIASILSLEIAPATNKLMPNGGVQKPIARLTVITTPKSKIL